MVVAMYCGNQAAIHALLGMRSAKPLCTDALLEPEVVNHMKQFLVDHRQCKSLTSMILTQYAFKRNHLSILELLLQTNEFDLNQKMIGDDTPLMWAICQSPRQLANLVKRLLETGKLDVNLSVSSFFSLKKAI
jgi:ankyrin repeat protein